MYKPEDIKKANRSSMGKGFVVLKDGKPTSIVVKYIVANIDKYRGKQFLDFGAGKYAVQTKYLRELGLDITAYDFGRNVTDIHDTRALERLYDIVYLSNVLNIQCSLQMLRETLFDVKEATRLGTEVIFNVPHEPCYSGLTKAEVLSEVERVFNSKPKKVSIGVYLLQVMV